MQGKRKEIQEYLAKNVNVFIQPLIYDIVKKRPADTAAHAVKWLQDYVQKKKQDKRKNKEKDCDGESSDEESEIPFDEQAFIKNRAKGKKRSRVGISEEVFGNFNKKQNVEYRKIPKSQEAKMLILGLIRSSILFSNLDQKDQINVIDAMEEKHVASGQKLIEQGSRGDSLFIVAEGQFECFKLINGQSKYLKCYSKGQAFGELSLMYNAPRAASIIAKTDGTVFELDRITFSHIVKQAAMRKRELYEKVISSVELFSELDPYEKEKFYDVLKQEKFESGQYIIKQGEEGKEFYIILEGNLIAEKLQKDDELPKIVYQYKQGDYFGELSLLHNVTRQASVKALTSVRLASIERESFKRLLGSFEEILKRNQEKYSNLLIKNTA